MIFVQLFDFSVMYQEADLEIRTHLQQSAGQIHMNGARQSSADRSMSTTSSQNGEDHQVGRETERHGDLVSSKFAMTLGDER